MYQRDSRKIHDNALFDREIKEIVVQFSSMTSSLLALSRSAFVLLIPGILWVQMSCSPPGPRTNPSLTVERSEPEEETPEPTPPPPPIPCPEADVVETDERRGDADHDAQRIAAAWCLVRNEAAERALNLLAPMISESSGEKGNDSMLRNYAQLIAGEAQLSLDNPEAAAATLAPLSFPEGPAARRLLNLRGEALVRSGRLEEGREQLSAMLAGSWGKAGKRPEPSGGNPSEARWWLAEAARMEADTDSHRGYLEDLWALHPHHPREEEVVTHLTALGTEPTSVESEEGKVLVTRRIVTLEGLYKWKAALALRDSLDAPNSQSGKSKLARVVLKARDYPRALSLYQELTSPGPGELLNTAVAATRTKNYPLATELYRSIYTRFGGKKARPASKTADQASYKIGYLAYDEGSHETAVHELKSHLKRYPKSRYAESARWFIAWSLIKSQRLDEARGALARLKQKHPKSSMVAACDYWTARIAGMQGDPEAEKKGLQAVLRKFPVSSYAWFASQTLATTWKVEPLPPPKLQPEVEDLAAVKRGRALATAGLDSWGRAELRSLKPILGKGSTDVVQAYAEALAGTGAWAEARNLVKKRCKPAQDRTADPHLARLCWPRPLGDFVSSSAAKGGISSHLPFAIMRAETGWKPWLTSPAGASGLMQIMPFLGESLTQELFPDRHWDPLDLYDPTFNATLGVAELVSLHNRFDGTAVDPRTPLVIAGYNGGEEAVRRWLGLYESPPPADVFAEDVGYTETRRYVRKVLATLMAYRYVYGDPPAAPEHP